MVVRPEVLVMNTHLLVGRARPCGAQGVEQVADFVVALADFTMPLR